MAALEIQNNGVLECWSASIADLGLRIADYQFEIYRNADGSNLKSAI